MRTVADHAGIATGTLYRYFPSKTHLLVSALIRELSRLEEWCDWSTIGSDAEQRLASLTARLHVEWQRNPLLTEAMTRAFVVADASACAEVDRATDVIERLLANALGGVNPSPRDMQVAGLLGDVWLANLTAFIGNRLSAREAQGSIDRTARLLLNRHHARIATERY